MENLNQILLEKNKSLERGKSLTESRKDLHFSLENYKSLRNYTREDLASVGGAFNAYEERRRLVNKSVKKVASLEKFLSKERNIQLESVEDYENLLNVALWEIDEYGFDTMASFPIFSTQNRSTPLDNLRYAENFINSISSEGFNVWSQIPYLDMNLPNLKIEKELETLSKFNEFYKPLLESGKIKNLYMRKGWENSLGCQTEHSIAEENNIKILYEK
jgi:hypothetical protein